MCVQGLACYEGGEARYAQDKAFNKDGKLLRVVGLKRESLAAIKESWDDRRVGHEHPI